MAWLTGGAAGAREASREDREALAEMHLLAEIVTEAAMVATATAQDEDVRDYAERLRKDHAFADRRVRSVAARVGVDLEAATRELQDERRHSPEQPLAGPPLTLAALQSSLEGLDQLQGVEFERTFVQQTRVAHELGVVKLKTARVVTAEPLPALLTKMVPIFHQHVELARSLEEDQER